MRELFLRAIADDDSAAMREGIEHLFGLTGDGLFPEAEFLLRHEDYVMEMPQSGERIRGADAMRAMQEAFPVPRPSPCAELWVPGGSRSSKE